MPIGGYVCYFMKYVNISDISVLVNQEKQAVRNLAEKVNNVSFRDLKNLTDRLNYVKELLGKAQKATDHRVDNSFGINTASIWEALKEDLGDEMIQQIDMELGGFPTKQGIAKFASTNYANGGDYVLKQIKKLYEVVGLQMPSGQVKGSDIDSFLQAVSTKIGTNTSLVSQITDNLINALKSPKATASLKNMRLKFQTMMNTLKANVGNGKNTAVFSKKGKNNMDLRQVLNDCISVLAPMSDYARAQGRFMEDVANIALQVKDGVANDAIIKLVPNVGDEQLRQSVRQTSILRQNSTKKTFTQGSVDYSVSGSASQRKVDAIFKINGNAYQASIKNYTFQKVSDKSDYYRNWISTVDATPLTTLMDAGDTAFNTAYANLFSKHPEITRKKGNYMFTDGAGNSVQLSQLRHQYLQALRLNAAVSSLIGSNQRVRGNGEDTPFSLVNDQANILIINDAATGKLQVISMYYIIQRLYDLVEKGGSAASVTTTIGKTSAATDSALVVDNKWVGIKGQLNHQDALTRSAAVWAALEEQKLSISINLNTILGI